MRISPAGILRFKPFEESGEEVVRARKVYARHLLLAAGVILSAAVLMIGLIAVVLEGPYARPIWFMGLGLSAITAGLEWRAGLRARPLNQLWIVVVTVGLVFLVDRL